MWNGESQAASLDRVSAAAGWITQVGQRQFDYRRYFVRIRIVLQHLFAYRNHRRHFEATDKDVNGRKLPDYIQRGGRHAKLLLEFPQRSLYDRLVRLDQSARQTNL